MDKSLLNEFIQLSGEVKQLKAEIQEQNRLLKKLVRGEVKERDEYLTTKQFKERENISQRSMYHILNTYPDLKSRKEGFGLMVNYTLFKKLKQ
jgi:ribosomal protein S28E/S33